MKYTYASESLGSSYEVVEDRVGGNATVGLERPRPDINRLEHGLTSPARFFKACYVGRAPPSCRSTPRVGPSPLLDPCAHGLAWKSSCKARGPRAKTVQAHAQRPAACQSKDLGPYPLGVSSVTIEGTAAAAVDRKG